jgi:hypothetical protein
MAGGWYAFSAGDTARRAPKGQESLAQGLPWVEWREVKKCLGGLMPRRGSVPEGRCDRSLARSAWNSPAPKEPSRRARYDRAQTQSQRYFASKCAPCFLKNANHSNHRMGAHTGANHSVPYGTALLRWRCSWHFVPGYDRTVPPGLGAKPFGAINRLKHSFS